jgi:hypothetical protein
MMPGATGARRADKSAIGRTRHVSHAVHHRDATTWDARDAAGPSVVEKERRYALGLVPRSTRWPRDRGAAIKINRDIEGCQNAHVHHNTAVTQTSFATR